jgi:hypothetical protein
MKCMKLEIYKYKGLYIISLLDECGNFVTSSGHYSLIEMQVFINRCYEFYPNVTFTSEWLGNKKEKVSYSDRLSKKLYKTCICGELCNE